MNYYQALDVNQSASESEIKKAFKEKALETHPDRGGDEEQFKTVNEAYDTLKNPDKRAMYDHELSGVGRIHVNVNSQEDIFGNIFRDLHDVFGENHPFAHQTRRYRKQAANKNLNVSLTLRMVDLLERQDKTLSVRQQTGERRLVQVSIPAGIRNETTIRYGGLGDNSIGSLPPGDLFVRIIIQEHPDFIRDNDNPSNLHINLTLNVFDAILGTNIPIKTLENKTLNVTIPAGTQHGTVLGLHDNGLPNQQTGHRGKLLVTIFLKIPENLTQAQVNIIERIRDET
jgi:curved DNA-binding protein